MLELKSWWRRGIIDVLFEPNSFTVSSPLWLRVLELLLRILSLASLVQYCCYWRDHGCPRCGHGIYSHEDVCKKREEENDEYKEGKQ